MGGMKTVAFIGGAGVGLSAGLVAGSKFDNDIVPAVVGLLGVGVGWLLGIGWDGVKRNRERREMRQLLRQELASNLYMLPQKRDTLKQLLEKLSIGEILSGDTTRFMSVAFTKGFPEIADELSLLERNSYHWIYDNFRTIDETMEAFAGSVISAGREDRTTAIRGWLGMLKDLIERTKLVETLVTKHLNGAPADVFHTSVNFDQIQSAIFQKPDVSKL